MIYVSMDLVNVDKYIFRWQVEIFFFAFYYDGWTYEGYFFLTSKMKDKSSSMLKGLCQSENRERPYSTIHRVDYIIIALYIFI